MKFFALTIIIWPSTLIQLLVFIGSKLVNTGRDKSGKGNAIAIYETISMV